MNAEYIILYHETRTDGDENEVYIQLRKWTADYTNNKWPRLIRDYVLKCNVEIHGVDTTSYDYFVSDMEINPYDINYEARLIRKAIQTFDALVEEHPVFNQTGKE